jgi:hypothetical protein
MTIKGKGTICEKIAALGHGTRVNLHLHDHEDLVLRVTSVNCDCGYLTGFTRNGRYLKVYMEEIRYFELE